MSGLWRDVQAAAMVASDRQVAAVCAVVAARAAALPGVVAAVEGDAVVLSGQGLRARAFGSRHNAADPRLAGLLSGDGA